MPGSPAIDAGNNALIPGGVTTDQRGLPRIVNGTVDIGAFESDGFILVLDLSAGGALSLAGNASINFSGVVYVDSSSSSDLSASGSAQVKAAGIDVHGNVQKSGNASLSPAPVTGAAVVADPLAGLSTPAIGTVQAAVNVGGNSSLTISPGTYSSITVSGNGKLTMKPGVYVIAGGGFSVSGSGAVTGSGVMIYNTKSSKGTYGSVSLSGNGAITLTAPTTGTYAGILIFQDRANSQALTFTGSAMLGMAGTIYAPAAQLVESGNARIGGASSPVTIVVDTMTISGSAMIQGPGGSSGGSTGAIALTSVLVPAADGISGSGLTPDGTGGSGAAIDGVGGSIVGVADTDPTGAVFDPTAPETTRLPTKIKVTDALGNKVSASSLPVVSMSAAGSAGTSVPQPAPESSQPVGLFAFDPADWTSRFNLKTKGSRLGS